MSLIVVNKELAVEMEEKENENMTINSEYCCRRSKKNKDTSKKRRDTI